ncbi:disulfide bond formation protein DsbA [Deinococcus irradiatisoli]|uniref:Disulfide bond formation protein DsbA n=1 Tax=Deinococcus irradiatisoli TaxID=2202254 RepID=A0A2Z3JCI8_9DEIO|nr:DsbA family oxidoreductase [Deinococcus irradiatisoli]AWN22752.1 disulfide bond formation protein DsbA [Deinococcus irradiatisoli]
MTQLLSPPTTPRLQVDIWSDIACPWCYIGKRRFEQALAQFPNRDQVDVVWHSFELDPSAPQRDEMAMRERLAAKYGRSSAEAQAMLDQMTQTAAGEGLEYHFEKAQPSNTFQAHQLLHLAAEHGVQDALKERFLSAYLREGQHLGDTDTLVALAAEVGLSPDEARHALEQQTYAQAVRQDEAQAQAYGIQGVPFFVLGGKYGVSGAQAPETLLGALKQVWSEQAPLQLIGADADGQTEGCEDGQCAVPGPR